MTAGARFRKVVLNLRAVLNYKNFQYLHVYNKTHETLFETSSNILNRPKNVNISLVT